MSKTFQGSINIPIVCRCQRLYKGLSPYMSDLWQNSTFCHFELSQNLVIAMHSIETIQSYTICRWDPFLLILFLFIHNCLSLICWWQSFITNSIFGRKVVLSRYIIYHIGGSLEYRWHLNGWIFLTRHITLKYANCFHQSTAHMWHWR